MCSLPSRHHLVVCLFVASTARRPRVAADKALHWQGGVAYLRSSSVNQYLATYLQKKGLGLGLGLGLVLGHVPAKETMCVWFNLFILDSRRVLHPAPEGA